MVSVPHSYQYRHASTLVVDSSRSALRLATSDAATQSHSYFFEGRVLEPRLVAQLLTSVHRVVGSRFFTPANTVAKTIALADPIVTSGGGLLRFEGFSSCCSTYVRVDLLPEAYDGDVVGKGTTNVDFNATMRAALAQVSDNLPLAFAIGRDEFKVHTPATEVIEKKVPLPVRWVRGMLEVQSYLAAMRKVWSVSGNEALRFFRTLPRASTSRTPLWIARGAAGLYATTREVERAVRTTDAARLRVLEPFLLKAREVIAYGDPAQQAVAFVANLGTMRLTLALSAEVWRGFSGEGLALSALMQANGEELRKATSHIRAQLAWQPALDAPIMARQLGVSESVVSDSLRVIGASGLAGFDVFEGTYFHRVLPFDVSMHANWHPRLLEARELVSSGAVRHVKQEPFEAAVASSGVEYRVRDVEGELRCTCPWFGKHQGLRGPCKHALAAAATRS